VRYRVWLPLAHTLIDSVLVAAWIWHAHGLIRIERQKDLSRVQTVILSIAAPQDSVEWEPIRVPPPPEFQVILTGTAPAGMVSMALRPDAARVYRQTLWDPIWFAIHEAFAIPFWLLLGLRFDSGHRMLGRTMGTYVCARGIFAMLSIGLGIARPGAAFQSLFWLALFIYALIRGLGWAIRRIAPPKRTVAS
jgi:hypothetical protein